LRKAHHNITKKFNKYCFQNPEKRRLLMLETYQQIKKTQQKVKQIKPHSIQAYRRYSTANQGNRYSDKQQINRDNHRAAYTKPHYQPRIGSFAHNNRRKAKQFDRNKYHNKYYEPLVKIDMKKIRKNVSPFSNKSTTYLIGNKKVLCNPIKFYSKKNKFARYYRYRFRQRIFYKSRYNQHEIGY